MKKKSASRGIQIMVILSFSSCFVEMEKTFTTSNEEICKCYTQSLMEGIDERLGECIEHFNKFISELSNSGNNVKEIEQFGKDGLLVILNELTKKCPSYRQSFLQLSIIFFGKLPKIEALEIIKQSEYEPESKIDTLKLIDSYITVLERDKANKLLDLFISKHPNSDYALWMKSYNYYMDKRIFEAVAVIDSAISVTKNQDLKALLGYYRNTINPLVNDRNEEITIKYTKEH